MPSDRAHRATPSRVTGTAAARTAGLAIRKLIQRAGWDVRRYKPGSIDDQYLCQIMLELDIQHVIDVGANVGQFGQKVRRELGFCGRLDSYEPSNRSFAELQSAAAEDPLWLPHSVALGGTDAKGILHTFASSDLNSLSAPRDGVATHWNIDWTSQAEEVEVRTLDSEPLPDLGPILLKLDTQGHDWEVLDGAARTLGRVLAIVTELSFIPLYESSRSAWDTMERLNGLGFGMAALAPITRPDGDHRLIEADGIFVRRPPGEEPLWATTLPTQTSGQAEGGHRQA